VYILVFCCVAHFWGFPFFHPLDENKINKIKIKYNYILLLVLFKCRHHEYSTIHRCTNIGQRSDFYAASLKMSVGQSLVSAKCIQRSQRPLSAVAALLFLLLFGNLERHKYTHDKIYRYVSNNTNFNLVCASPLFPVC